MFRAHHGLGRSLCTVFQLTWLNWIALAHSFHPSTRMGEISISGFFSFPSSIVDPPLPPPPYVIQNHPSERRSVPGAYERVANMRIFSWDSFFFFFFSFSFSLLFSSGAFNESVMGFRCFSGWIVLYEDRMKIECWKYGCSILQV